MARKYATVRGTLPSDAQKLHYAPHPAVQPLVQPPQVATPAKAQPKAPTVTVRKRVRVHRQTGLSLYVPNCADVFNAAMGGFLAGVNAYVDTGFNAMADQDPLVAEAELFAQAVDEAIGVTSCSEAQVGLVTQYCQSVIADKYATDLSVTDYGAIATAMAQLYAAAAGSFVPSPSGTGYSTVQVNGTALPAETTLDLVAGSGATLTGADVGGVTRVTVSASGGVPTVLTLTSDVTTLTMPAVDTVYLVVDARSPTPAQGTNAFIELDATATPVFGVSVTFVDINGVWGQYPLQLNGVNAARPQDPSVMGSRSGTRPVVSVPGASVTWTLVEPPPGDASFPAYFMVTSAALGSSVIDYSEYVSDLTPYLAGYKGVTYCNSKEQNIQISDGPPSLTKPFTYYPKGPSWDPDGQYTANFVNATAWPMTLEGSESTTVVVLAGCSGEVRNDATGLVPMAVTPLVQTASGVSGSATGPVNQSFSFYPPYGTVRASVVVRAVVTSSDVPSPAVGDTYIAETDAVWICAAGINKTTAVTPLPLAEGMPYAFSSASLDAMSCAVGVSDDFSQATVSVTVPTMPSNNVVFSMQVTVKDVELV